jgi:hypothetical protein
MESSAKQSLHASLRAALPRWIEDRALLDSALLQALAGGEINIAPDEVDLVVASLNAEVHRELHWIDRWESAEQGGESTNLPVSELPIYPRYQKCRRLIAWASSRGAGERVPDVYLAIKETFPQDADTYIDWLT